MANLSAIKIPPRTTRHQKNYLQRIDTFIKPTYMYMHWMHPLYIPMKIFKFNTQRVCFILGDVGHVLKWTQ